MVADGRYRDIDEARGNLECGVSIIYSKKYLIVSVDHALCFDFGGDDFVLG